MSTAAIRYRAKTLASDLVPGGFPGRYSHGDVLVARQGVWTQAKLENVGWGMRSDPSREAIIRADLGTIAALGATRVHWRTAYVPVPIADWVESQEEWARNPLDTWGALLQSESVHLGNRVPRRKVTLLDVRVADRGRFTTPTKERLADWGEAARGVQSLLSGSMRGKAGGKPLLEWWHRHAAAPGLRSQYLARPDRDLIPTDFPTFAPYTAKSLPGGPLYVSCGSADVVVLYVTLKKLPSRNVPPEEPHWHLADQISGGPIEWDIHAESNIPATVREDVRKKLDAAVDIVSHVRQSGSLASIDNQQRVKKAQELEELLTSSAIPFPYVHARAVISVPVQNGDVEKARKESLRRAEALIAFYGPAIELAIVPKAQRYYHRSAFPGSTPEWTEHFTQRMSMAALVGGMARCSVELGNGEGFAIGETITRARSTVFWHPWSAIEKEGGGRPAGTAFVGESGSGKTMAFGATCALSAVAGAKVVAFEPPGRLARLAQWDKLDGQVEHIDLADAGPGLIDPARTVPWPGRQASVEAMAAWQAEVQDGWLDALHLLLPMATDPELRGAALSMAIDKAISEYPTGLYRVIHHLEAIGKSSHVRANLRAMADNLRYVLGTYSRTRHMVGLLGHPVHVPQTVKASAALTVISMRGVPLPKVGKAQDKWRPSERAGAALFHAGAQYARRLLSNLPPATRKLLGLDEAYMIMALDSGIDLVVDGVRGGRKESEAVMIATQATQDLTDERVLNSLSSVFAFRSTIFSEVQAQCALLRREAASSHLAAIQSLDNGQAAFLDPWDNCDLMQWDMTGRPELFALLDSRATAGAPARLVSVA